MNTAQEDITTIHKTRLGIVIRSAMRMAKRSEQSVLVWAFVSRLTGYGSTYSFELCRQMDMNPEITVKEYIK